MNDKNQVAAEAMESEKTCGVHGCKMEWIAVAEGRGSWFCQECWDDAEEAAYVPADLSDVALPPVTVDEDGVVRMEMSWQPKVKAAPVLERYTKKDKKESKTRRKMAAKSRRINGRR